MENKVKIFNPEPYLGVQHNGEDTFQKYIDNHKNQTEMGEWYRKHLKLDRDNTRWVQVNSETTNHHGRNRINYMAKKMRNTTIGMFPE
jgi:hypothetical protein